MVFVLAAATAGAQSLSFSDVNVTEGANGVTTQATFTVTLSPTSSGAVTVSYATIADGSGTESVDFTATSGTLTFAAGEDTKTFTVDILGDNTDESDETAVVELTDGGSLGDATIGVSQAAVNIDDDDGPGITIFDQPMITESGFATFFVILDATSPQTVSVDFTTGDDSGSFPATAGADYTPTSGTVNISAGGLSGTITVAILSDSNDEEDQTFQVRLSNAVDGTIGTTEAVGTIIDDDDPPVISVANSSVTEGDAVGEDVQLDFTVTVTPSSEKTITVAYATADVEATTAADYSATATDDDGNADNGTLTFAANDTSAVISVPISEDFVNEDTETLTLNLTSSTNATLEDTADTTGPEVGTGTITDDDLIFLTFTESNSVVGTGDQSVDEADSGSAATTYTVFLDPAMEVTSDQAVNFTVTTTGVTATDGTDFTGLSASANTISAGSMFTQFTVSATGERVNEPDETYTVALAHTSGGHGTVTAVDTATGSILDDDPVVLTIAAATPGEADGTADFVVSFDPSGGNATTAAATLNFVVNTSDGTAGSADYTAAAPGAGSITANAANGTVSITIADDTVNEASETFTTTLSSITGDQVGTGSGAAAASFESDNADATITDNDAIVLTVVDASVTEGESPDSANIAFTVYLDANFTMKSDEDVLITVTTADGTSGTAATADVDYTALSSSTQTITTGSTFTTFNVTVAGDNVNEADETIDISLAYSSGGHGTPDATDTAIGTITDDDPIVFTIADDSQDEGDASADLTFKVYLAADLTTTSTTDVNFDLTLTGVEATDGTDFVDQNATAYTILQGQPSVDVPVNLTGDRINEADETFTLSVAYDSGGNGTPDVTDTATGSILDDDPVVLTINDVTPTEGANASFTVSFDAGSINATSAANSLTYTITTTAGTAVEGTDYTDVPVAGGTITALATTDTIDVATTDDDINEDAETFTVVLSSLSGDVDGTGTGHAAGSFGDDTGLATITDNDQVVLTVGDITLTEGDTGTSNMTFTVYVNSNMTMTSDAAISFTTTTTGVTATDTTDFTVHAASAQTIPLDTASVDVTVAVVGEYLNEVDETFTLALASPTGGFTGAGALTVGYPATGTITDNDIITLTVADVSGAENVTPLAFNVFLDAAGNVTSDEDLHFRISTGDGTATILDSDYTAISSVSYTIDAGQTNVTASASGSVDVVVANNTVNEADETLTISVFHTAGGHGTVDDSDGATGTITNDDLIVFTFDTDPNQDEQDSSSANMTFRVYLDAAQALTSDENVDFDVTTSGGTATGGTDYTPLSASTETISAGAAYVEFTVAITGDLVNEGDETVIVSVAHDTSPGGSNHGGHGDGDVTDFGTGSIDGDDPVVLDITWDGDVTEGVDATFTVDFDTSTATNATSAASDLGFTITPTDTGGANDTETADYTASPTTDGTITAGTASGTITFTTADDVINEDDETFTVTLTTITGAVQGTGTEGAAASFGTSFDTGTLNDNDNVVLFIDDETEAEDGTMTFTVYLMDPGVQATVGETDVLFTVSTADGSSGKAAEAGSDYIALTTSAQTILATATNTTFTVSMTNDTVNEDSETIDLSMSYSSGAFSSSSAPDDSDTAVGTIDDNDEIVLTITDVSQDEEDTGSTMTFTVTLNAAGDMSTDSTVNFTVSTSDGGGSGTSATATSDYTALVSSAKFIDGNGTDLNTTFTVTTAGDNVNEGDEEFTVTLTYVSGGFSSTATPVGTDTALGTLEGDDPVVLDIAWDGDVTEGVDGVFTVSFNSTPGTNATSAASQLGFTITPTAAGGNPTATAGSDYIATPAGGTITALATTGTITFTTSDDTVNEDDEDFTVTLTTITGAATGTGSEGAVASFGTGNVIATLIDNDNIVLYVADETAEESDTMTFTVYLMNPGTQSTTSAATVTFDFDTSDVTATTIDSDYTAVSGSGPTIAIGNTSTTVTVPMGDDNVNEAEETLTVTLSNIAGGFSSSSAPVGTDTATGTISNDDLITAKITDAVIEETSGTVTFTLSLDPTDTITCDEPVVVNITTADLSSQEEIDLGLSSATASTDYTPLSAFDVTISSGSPSNTFTVTIAEDTVNEDSEGFLLNMASTSGGHDSPDFSDPADATITDDDDIVLTVANVTGDEQDTSVTDSLTFTVYLDSSQTITSDEAVIIAVTTTGVEATDDADYVDQNSELYTIAIGQTNITVPVVMTGDNVNEGDETFTLAVVHTSGGHEQHATVDATDTATGTLLGDDPVHLTISDPTQSEGTNLGFSVSFVTSNSAYATTAASELTFTVNTSDGSSGTTATATTDYTSISTGGGSITAGQTSGTVTVTVVEDTVNEDNETIDVTLTSLAGDAAGTGTEGAGGAFDDNVGLGTISNDDLVILSIADVAVAEGDSATTNLQFTVYINADTVMTSDSEVFFDVVTADGSSNPATASADYTAITTGAADQSIAAAATSTTFNVVLTGDEINEADETIDISLVYNSGGNDGPDASDTAVGTITNDDLIVLTVEDVSSDEGDTGGSTTFNFTVDLGDAAMTSDEDVVFSVTLTGESVNGDDAAADGTDFTDQTATEYTISTGTSDQGEAVPVVITVEDINEGDETFTVNVAHVSGGHGSITASDTATGTIQGDDPVVLQIADSPSVTEGADASFTVSFSTTGGGLATSADEDLTYTITVTPGTSITGGSATLGQQDYTATPTTGATGSILATVTTDTVTVATNDDTVNEGSETFDVTISAVVGAESAGAVAPTVHGVMDVDTATLSDNDAIVLSVADAQADEDTGVLTFTVYLDSGQALTSDDDVIIAATTSATGNSPATATVDYTSLTASAATITAGDTSVDIAVTMTSDAGSPVFESDETFALALAHTSGGDSAPDATDTAVGTITNDDAVPEIQITDATADEGDGGTTSYSFTVSMSPAADSAMAVPFTLAGVSATDTEDFDSTSVAENDAATDGTIDFAAGDTSFSITLDVIGDTLFEVDETFTITLGSATGGATIHVSENVGTGTITNDDPLPTITITADTDLEGDSATTTLTFTVTINGAVGSDVTVDYQTIDGLATTADNDYSSSATDDDSDGTSGVLTILQGATSQVISVDINGDTKIENNETFSVSLSNPVNATWSGFDFGVVTLQAIGTITNDDTSLLTISPTVVVVTEGDSGTTTLQFDVFQTPANISDVTVQYTVAGVDATDGEDFDSTSVTEGDAASSDGTLTFPAGVSKLAIFVPIIGDLNNEPSETLTLTLDTAVNSVIDTENDLATATITDNDAIVLSMTDVGVDEGDSATGSLNFIVTLNSAGTMTSDVDVNFTTSTAAGSATVVTDYTELVEAAGTVMAGELFATVSVPVLGDRVNEGDETLAATLAYVSGGIGSVTGGASATGTIRGDDPVLLAIADPASVVEGIGVDFTVSFDTTGGNATSAEDEITFTVTSGDPGDTADVGSDYDALGSAGSIAAGLDEDTFTITTTDDAVNEADETFTVVLSEISGGLAGTGTGGAVADFADDTAVGTLTSDDAIVFTVTPTSVVEGDDGTVNLTFSVALDAAGTMTADEDVTFNVDTIGGTATAGTDYDVLLNDAHTISASETDVDVTVTVNDDTLNEEDETVTIGISHTTGGHDTATAVIDDSNEGTGTITDNDAIVLTIGDVAVTEGDSSSTNMTFMVSLDATGNVTSDQDVLLTVTTVGDSATAGTDYTADLAAQSITISSGSTSNTVDAVVAVTGEAVNEGDETINASLAWVSGGHGTVTATDTAVGTITGDDPVVLTIADVTSVAEGSAAVFSVTFDTTTGNATETTSPLTFAFDTGDDTDTAVGDRDYTSVTTGSGAIAAGETSTTVSVTTTDDTVYENDETLTVVLSALVGANATFADDTAVATVTSEDVAPSILFDTNATAAFDEEDDGTATATITLSHPSALGVTVDYATSQAGDAKQSRDYQAKTGSVSFDDEFTTDQEVTVLLEPDVLDENDETFDIALSNAAGGSITVASHTLTITDNDPLPTVSIASIPAQGEGAAGDEVGVSVNVSLDVVSGRDVTVSYFTEEVTDSATPDVDYTTVLSTDITFVAGETTKQVQLTILGDDVDEPNESFSVTLGSTPTNATVGTGTREITISDDDVVPKVSIGNSADVTESSSGVLTASFAVSLDTVSAREITVNYTILDGTATLDEDYEATSGTSGTVTFAVGADSATIDVTVLDDLLDEDDESFTVRLSNPTNVTFAQDVGTVTIIDDDLTPTISLVDPVAAAEGSGDDPSETVTVTVQLSDVSGRNVSVNYATAADTGDNPATTGEDYVHDASTVTISAGATEATFDITLLGDYDDEPDETFRIILSFAANTEIDQGTTTVTITDDDEPPVTVTAPTSATAGSDVEISAVIVLPISSVTSASVFYGQGGSAPVAVASFVQDGTTTTWNATIPGSSVGMGGIVWYAQVSDSLARTFGENTLSVPGYIPVDGSVDISITTTATMITAPNIWNVVGPPVSPDDTSMEATFGVGGFISEWFAWRWDSSAQEWQIAESLSDSTPVATDAFETGKGWFVAVVGDGSTATRTVTGRSIDPRSRFSVPLSAGWNLVANPYSFPVDWRDDRVAVAINNAEQSPSAWGSVVDNRAILLNTATQAYESARSSAATSLVIDAGQAFWFLSSTAGELLLDPVATSNASPSLPAPWAASASLASVGEWRVIVTATSELGSDGVEAIAATNAGSVGGNALSYVKAPSFPGSSAPRVSLVNPAESGFMARLDTDIQTIGDEMVWLLDVSNGDGAVISWRTIDLPSDYELQLVDLTSERVIDMRQDGQIRLEGSGFNSRQYALKAVKRYIPEVTRLLPNYPNPFNPETWIPFELAEESEVDITIYSMGGEVVRRLELGRMREGAYVTREQSAHWDGRNDLGERVASAVYVYEIKAGDHVERRRLVVLK